MTALFLLISTFCLVFFLGLQSLVVNSGYRWLAFGNSFAIGLSNLALFKLAPDAGGVEILAYLLGGPFGIVLAMVFFKWYHERKERIALKPKSCKQCKWFKGRFLPCAYSDAGANYGKAMPPSDLKPCHYFKVSQ